MTKLEVMTAFKRSRHLLFSTYLIAALSCGVQAQVIKLATLAPDGSSWHQLLIEIGQQWYRDSGGDLRLRVYPGGVAGDERDMIRKMLIGQFQAAVVSVEGLGHLSPSMNVLYVPLLVDSFNELESIKDELFPVAEKELEEKGIKLLAWLNVGWVYLFSRDPVTTPQELRKMKIFSWAGNYYTVELWDKAGFRPVPLAFTDVLPALQTGIVDAVSGLPLLVLAYQWFRPAPHMLNLRWIPVTVALVMNWKVWDAIGEDRHEAIMNAVYRAEKMSIHLAGEDSQAVEVMKAHGLKVHDLDPSQKKLWIDLSHEMYPLIRGRLVPEKIFDLIHSQDSLGSDGE